MRPEGSTGTSGSSPGGAGPGRDVPEAPRRVQAKAPVLVFAIGNPSRGDDALGPELARRIELEFEAAISAGQLEVLTDFQLQVECILDLEGREHVVFADAATNTAEPFAWSKVLGARDRSVSTHQLSPAALLSTYREVLESEPPECWVAAIRGSDFELGAPLSPLARANLEEAVRAVREHLSGWLGESLSPRVDPSA